ncbi:hypothetical protein EVC12_222 [Rhizobium phage RHph_I42]|nr:hypothetical protein EVC12_222 [Rhizobium phage RHph_I42]
MDKTIFWAIVIVLIVVFLIYQLFFKNKPAPVFETNEDEELSASQRLRVEPEAIGGTNIDGGLVQDGVTITHEEVPAKPTLVDTELLDTLAEKGMPIPERIREEVTKSAVLPVASEEADPVEPAPTNVSRGGNLRKFSDQDVRDIRGDQRDPAAIAKERGVTTRTIERIKSYDTYATVR